ncbi:MAG: amidase family protein, partial [Pseudomonadota bacterium]
DAYAVFRAASAYDAADPYARKVAAPPMASPPPAPRVAIPEAASLVFEGDGLQEHSFRQGVAALQSAGAQLTEIDLTPFQAVAELLYDGPWIAERHSVVGPLLESTPEAVDPAVRAVIAKAQSLSATDAFRGHYRLAELRREIEGALAGLDVLCLPSIPGFCTLAEIAADPLGANARLGTYTNFVNLLGFCALAVPLPARADGRPASVTLVARHGHDATLAALALTLEAHGPRTLGATDWAVPPAPVLETRAVADEIEIAVCGAHMSGLALNAQLTERGGRFLRQSETLPEYRLYRLPGGPPVRPGLVRTGGGAAIAVEVWALPLSEVGGFLTEIPSPLGLATVALADGTTPKGFLCEHWATVEAEDVTAYGNWRAVTARLAG